MERDLRLRSWCRRRGSRLGVLEFLRAFVAAAEGALQGDIRREGRRVELQQRIALLYPGFGGGELGARVGDALAPARRRAGLEPPSRIGLDQALSALRL